ncbi:hypothetical protein Droror1_Dr00008476 [Drosera rotundifolia]
MTSYKEKTLVVKQLKEESVMATPNLVMEMLVEQTIDEQPLLWELTSVWSVAAERGGFEGVARLLRPTARTMTSTHGTDDDDPGMAATHGRRQAERQRSRRTAAAKDLKEWSGGDTHGTDGSEEPQHGRRRQPTALTTTTHVWRRTTNDNDEGWGL